MSDRLNFANYGAHWSASTPFGAYFLTKNNNNRWEISQSFMSPSKLETKHSFEAAKRYAQDDYSRRLNIATNDD